MEPTENQEGPRTGAPSANTSQVWLAALILFVASFTLFTQQNQFKFFYHPDENGKVEQIQRGQWNFNHPMLMLNVAEVAASATGPLDNSQRVAQIGRTVSAVFAAGSVAMLAAMAWITVGPFAGIATGLLLLSNHQLFELAHYFKEDTALLFGISAWVLALGGFWKRPNPTNAALVGAGAALAVSGKYVGAFAPLLSLWLLPLRGAGQRKALLGAFFGAFVALFSLTNLPLLLQLATFESSFQREMGLVIKGQSGMTRSVPHTIYWNAFRKNVPYAVWPFIFFYLHSCWRRRRSLGAFEWVLTAFPIVFLVVLSFSPKSNDRYFLPATALFLCLAARGMSHLHSRVANKRAIPLLLGVCLLVQGVGTWDYLKAFRIDDRADLVAWVNAHLPGAVLAQDDRVQLPTAVRPEILRYQPALQATVVCKGLNKVADLPALRASGAEYVVLSESDYGRFFLKSLRSQKGQESGHTKSRSLYETLRRGKPLWSRPRDTVIYLHPGLEVYPMPKLDGSN